jgi:hypothetical protein
MLHQHQQVQAMQHRDVIYGLDRITGRQKIGFWFLSPLLVALPIALQPNCGWYVLGVERQAQGRSACPSLPANAREPARRPDRKWVST